MKKFSKSILWAFLLATAAGFPLHFLYQRFPSLLTAVIAPVNESIWEHLKLIYWPFLTAALILTRRGERGNRAPWLLSLLVISVALLGIGYWYNISYGGENSLFNIVLYVILMGAGFLLPRLFVFLAGKGWWSEALGVLVILLGGLILLFTWLPPDLPLFADLSAARTWGTIPY